MYICVTNDALRDALRIYIDSIILLLTFHKKLYQLARLVNGQEYDWHFKIAESKRDTGCVGSRQEIIRLKIRDKFKNRLPHLYSSFKKSYNTQVRNSIAHSKYSFLSRYIHLNNYIKEDKASQLISIDFNDWVDTFHETMVLYNEYIGFFNKVNTYYADIAKKTIT